MDVVAKSKNSKKVKRRMVFLGFTSVIIIFAMTFTIGKYWIEIIDKYREKKNLDEELVALKEKEEQLQVDAKNIFILRKENLFYKFLKNNNYFSFFLL